MRALNLKVTHKPVREYYESLQQYESLDVAHEGAVKVQNRKSFRAALGC
jgi:hypothetical protein